MIRVISLGAGVQSSTMYRMAAEGLFGRAQMPTRAIFADTQAEPKWVYDQIEHLRTDHGSEIPIDVVTAGSLEDAIHEGGFSAAPFWVKNEDGTRGMGRRQCTREFKIAPLHRRARELAGLAKGERSKGVVVEMWVGISTDEAHRMKPADEAWLVKRYPLIERGMSRRDCLAWLDAYNHPIPKKSSCYFCPYRGDDDWRVMRDTAPLEFFRATTFDAMLRIGTGRNQYVHDSLKPLAEARLRAHQPDMFGNECEGMCGV